MTTSAREASSGSGRAMRADARRSRETILAAAGELFASRGSAVEMDEIADRAGLGVGTLYRHFTDRQGLLTAIVGQRFEAMTDLARAAEEIDDPGEAFRGLLLGYLQAAEVDALFRYAILGPDKTAWGSISAQKREFTDIAERILHRAVDAAVVRDDFTFADFVHITRAAMANMNPDDQDWRRLLTLVCEGIRGTTAKPAKPDNP